MVEYLPNMHKVLALILSTKTKVLVSFCVSIIRRSFFSPSEKEKGSKRQQ
jgi:hypothetical protein